MIALLLAFVALLLGLHGPAPAPHGHGVTAAPAPAVVAPPAARGASRGPSGASRAGRPSGGSAIPLPQPPAARATVAAPPAPVCGPGEDVDEDSPTGCITRQLPDEVIGRQEDLPDGSVCTVTDAAGDTVCEPPAAPRS